MKEIVRFESFICEFLETFQLQPQIITSMLNKQDSWDVIKKVTTLLSPTVPLNLLSEGNPSSAIG